MARSPQVPATVSTAIISLILGGVLGYYAQTFLPHAQAVTPASHTAMAGASRGAGGAPGGMGGGGGFGGGGFGGGGFGGPPSPSMELSRTVRNLNTIEEVQNRGLTPAQKAQIAPILRKIQASTKLSDDDAKADSAAIDKILTPDQHAALTSLQPQRGGRGGGGRGGRGGGGGFGGGGFGGGFGGGGGQGGSDNPFASGRGKDALASLITLTKS